MKVKFTKEPKRYNLLTKSALLSILVFSVGTSSVLASEIQTPTPSSTPASVNVTQNTAETTGLLPGDFFYFVKTMYENIRLALTVNDIKEARLLTSFAQERLGEANTLLAKGKTNEASLSLQKSLETQQNAIQKTEQASGLSTTEKTALATSATPSVDTEAKTTTTEQTETKDVNDTEKEVKHPEQVLKVKTELQHNILALASALEKVGNPKAQSALMKNIEKSFSSVPSPIPSQVISQVRNESVSIQEQQDDSVKEKADHTKKSKDNKEKNRSEQEKDRKNNNQHGGSEKENGKGNDKNKGNKQE